MKFFLDTADIDVIKQLNDTGLVDGVTTNPSLIYKNGGNIFDTTAQICDIVDGPVSAETIATDHTTMLQEGLKLAKIAKNIAVKVPLTFDGLKTCKALRDKDIMVNVTLCFSSAQAILAAKAGASFISPFVGRLDDVGQDGMALIAEITDCYRNYYFETEILVASIRGPQHVIDSAKIGADIATMPPDVLTKMVHHPLTDNGLDIFLKDWEKTGQSIL